LASDGGDGGPLVPGPLTALSASANFEIIATNHETAIAVAAHNTISSGQVANWVVVANNNPGYMWAVSQNLDGSVWDAFTDSSLAFGNPCNGLNGGYCMSDDGSFATAYGDPYLATVTQPDANGSPSPYTTTGTKVLYTSIAKSNLTTTGATDVLIAISENGGLSFDHARLVSYGLTAPGGLGPGGTVIGADNPVIASHLVAPYSTFVAWTAGSDQGAFMRQVFYDATLTFTPGLFVTIPPSSTGTGKILHPALAIGQLTSCATGGTDEIVYVAWADRVDGAGCECDASPNEGPACTVDGVRWFLAAYDTSTSSWLTDNTTGATSWQVGYDSAWPGCVGFPLDGGRNYSDNDVRPRLAVEPQNQYSWVTWVSHTVVGTRVNVQQQTLDCSCTPPCSGGYNLSVTGLIQGPTYCYTGSGCQLAPPDGGPPYNGPGGTYIPNDQWGPAIAFVRDSNSGIRKLVVSYYDTWGDMQNIKVNMAAMYDAENTITLSNLPSNRIDVGAGGGVPWVHSYGTWFDYQAVAAEPITFTFLGAWGGDARDASWAGLFTAVIK
jgi:hypothetical protein